MNSIERGTWLALGAMGVAIFVLANDFSAINVAIPQIEKDFETNVTTTQWVVNAYALTFGVLLVTGGRLADLFGRSFPHSVRSPSNTGWTHIRTFALI